MAGAATTYSVSKIYNGDRVTEKHTFTWVADDGTAAVTSKATTLSVVGYVILGTISVGTTTSTADITIKDSDGVDVFGAELSNMPSQALPKIGNAYGDRFVGSILTFAMANNAVLSANGSCNVYVLVET